MEQRSIEQLIRSRRTIHHFKTDVSPDPELIRAALDAAKWAPNHRLTEPWHFYWLEESCIIRIHQFNAELVRRKNGDRAAAIVLKKWGKAPGWLVVTCKKSVQEIQFREDYASCCCLMQNLMLLLWEHGVGMKWSTGELINMPKFYELINVDIEREQIVGIFWYGYPQVVPEVNRAPIKEKITYLS